MKHYIKTFGAAIPRNAKLIAVLALVFAGYQHGKYVGELGGKYDSAAYEGIIAQAAAMPEKQRIYAADQYIDANPPKYSGR